MNYYPHKNLDDTIVVTLNDSEIERNNKFAMLEKYSYTSVPFDTYVAFCLTIDKWNKFIKTKRGFAWLLASGAAMKPDLIKP